jgi:L-amino acid N-acyltransferase YncA
MFISADEWMEISIQNDWMLKGVNERLEELYGVKESLTPEDWNEMRRRADSELLLVYTVNEAGAVLGVAQATYSFRPPYPKVYVNSVVVSKSFRGQSAGSALMQELHKRCLERWPRTQMFQLTSAPKRGTRPFYERLGYTARPSNELGGTIDYERRL